MSKNWHIALYIALGIGVIALIYIACVQSPVFQTLFLNNTNTTNTTATPANSSNASAIVNALPKSNIDDTMISKAAAISGTTTVPMYALPASGTQADVLTGCYTLLQNISTANANYQPFLKSYNALNSSYTQTAGNTLWLQLNNFYWNEVNTLVNGMTVVVNRQVYATNANSLLNSATGNYSITGFATSLVGLLNACQQEITNEFIEAVDSAVYQGYGSYSNYAANIVNGVKQSGSPSAYDLQSAWEYLKWQISSDTNLATVPYEITTPAAPQTTIINNAAFANNGYGIVSDSTGLYYYNWDRSTLYGSNHVFTNGASIYSAFTNYQQPGPYGPSGQGIYGKLWKCSNYYMQQQAISAFVNALPNIPTLSATNGITAAQAVSNNSTVESIVTIISKIL